MNTVTQVQEHNQAVRPTEKEVFEFNNYKDFLHAQVGPPGKRSGVKGAIARALRCQPTYVSQVLNGSSHFSLEQGDEIADFFGLTSGQKHFFLLLLQRERAGTKKLNRYFTIQIEELLRRRLVLTSRLGGKNSLSKEAQSIYYSSWIYAAIHMALTIPELRSPDELARYLGLPKKRVGEAVEFLCRAGVVKKVEGGLHVGDAQIRLGNHSYLVVQHHANWRNKAIESLERETLTDLHYSAVVTLSRADVLKLKDSILEFMRQSLLAIRASREEELYSFCIDLFHLKNPCLDT